MEEIRINNFKEKLIYEKLDNGLRVYLLPQKNKKNYNFSYLVNYGGRNIKFKVDNVLKETKTGIAHFLEHKMFERDNDPFTYYNKSGTDVNASTSSEYTHYYIFGNKSFKKNLTYLVNWIKTFNTTNELVKKEQGIILEEASMYKDNPDRVLNEKARENVFINDPYKYKVIGSDEDIVSITKEDLKLCFDSFYRPDNMYIIGTGNFNPKEALDIIKENTKDFKSPKSKIEKYFDKEPDEIKKECIKYMNIDTPRISLSYKFNKNIIKNLKLDDFTFDLYLSTLLYIGFSRASDINEKWLKEKTVIYSNYRILSNETHYAIEFYALTNNIEKYQKELEEYLKDIKIDENSFERVKKVWIADEVEIISNISHAKQSIISDIIEYNKFIPNKIDIIKSLKYEKILKIKEILKFKDNSIVKILSNNSKVDKNK